MAALVPKDISVHHVHDVNINLNVDFEKIGGAVESIIWTFAFASILRSRFRK
jgi:hypothetical protein